MHNYASGNIISDVPISNSYNMPRRAVSDL